MEATAPWARLLRWFTRSTGLADQLQTLRPWNFIINRPPLQGFLVLALVSPGMFFLLNAVFRSEWVPLSHQWMSALVGDVFLAAMGGFYLHLINEQRYLVRVFWHRMTHYVWIAVWYAFGLFHSWQESGSLNWEQRLGPNYLYHTLVVYPLLGYALIVLTWTMLRQLDWGNRVVGIVMFLGCVGVWAFLGMYDGSHQYAPGGISKHIINSPEDGWHNLRLLGEGVWWLLESMAEGVGMLSEIFPLR